MEVWESIVAVGFLFAVIGNTVCPCAGATPAPSSLTDMASQFKGLPMADLIGGPLNAAARANEQMAKAMEDFLKCADLDEFAPGPLGMSITLQQIV
jgi:hypothetical protein